MPAAIEKQPFALADMGDLAKELHPDLAEQIDSDQVPHGQAEGAAAEQAAEGDDAVQPATPREGMPTEEELLNAGGEKPEEEKPDEGGEKPDDDAAIKESEAAKAAEEEKKKAEEAAAAAAAAKSTEAKPRDADLDDKLAQHTHPKTRKAFEEKNAKIKAARDERDAIIAEREALKQQLAEREKQVAAPAVPKEIDEELKTLRERVRELDITKDPVLEQKYDRRITANNDGIVAVLKGQGIGLRIVDREKGTTVEDPSILAGLVKAGLTFKNLQPYISKLEEAGLIDEAEAIREGIRENSRITKEKSAEIESWKANYSDRLKQREAQTTQEQAKRDELFRTQTQTALKTDLEVLAKDFPHINAPPAPLATDTPAVAKAKQAALDEYTASARKVEAAVKAFDTTGLPPEKAAEAVGKLNASAIQAIVLKSHVLPRVIKEIAAKDARIKELESQLGRFKGATNLSKQHAAPASGGNQEIQIPKDAPLADAMASFAKQMGQSV